MNVQIVPSSGTDVTVIGKSSRGLVGLPGGFEARGLAVEVGQG